MVERTTRKNILYVEDEFIIADATANRLHSFGYLSITAHSGEKAVEIVRTRDDIDLVLMDIDLGSGMDGTEAAKKILAIRHIPIVFLTSHTEEEYVNRVKAITHYGYVLKRSGDFVLKSSIDMAFELFNDYEKTRYSIDRVTDSVLWVDENGKFIDVNERACKNLGYDREELLTMGVADIDPLFPQEVWPSHWEEMKQCKVMNIESIHQKKDGTRFPVEVIVHNQQFGDTRYNFVLVRDITQRKKNEEKIYKTQSILQEAEKLSNIGSYEWDIGNETITVSEGWRRIHGCKKESLSFDELMPIAHPDDAEKIQKAMNKALADIRAYDLEHRIIRRNDGAVRWIKARGKVIFDGSGNPVTMYGSVEDITERKSWEQEIQATRNELQAIYDTSPILMCVLDSQRAVLNANQTFKDVTGWPNAPFRTNIACGVLGCVNALDNPRGCGYGNECKSCAIFCAINKTLTTGESQHNIEFHTIIEDNGIQKEIYMLAFIESFNTIEERRVLLCLLDITDRKGAEEALKKALSEKEILLKEVHHRVKNNMQTIQSLLYKQQQDSNDQHIRDVLEDSIHRVTSMALIHEQLYRSKDLSHIDFADYIRDLSGKLCATYYEKEKCVSLTVQAANLFLPVDKAIPVALIVNELLSNTLKYAFPKNREGNIWIELSHDRGSVTLTVKDDGIGLPEAFDISKVESLGLYLVFNIATKQLGGRVSIHNSNPTAFSIHFSI